jgi:hypothetical protein
MRLRLLALIVGIKQRIFTRDDDSSLNLYHRPLQYLIVISAIVWNYQKLRND